MTWDYLLCLLQILYCGSLASNDCSLDLGMLTVKYTSDQTVSKSVSEPQISRYPCDVTTKWHAIKDLLARFLTFDFICIALTTYYASTIYLYDIFQKGLKCSIKYGRELCLELHLMQLMQLMIDQFREEGSKRVINMNQFPMGLTLPIRRHYLQAYVFHRALSISNLHRRWRLT